MISVEVVEFNLGKFEGLTGKPMQGNAAKVSPQYFEGYQVGFGRYLSYPESIGAIYGRSQIDEIKHRRTLAQRFERVADQLSR